MEVAEERVVSRDYNEDPIVIVDYNHIFSSMFMVITVLIIAYLFFLSSYGAYREFFEKYFFIHILLFLGVPGLVYYFQIKNTKRKILLRRDRIVFLEADNVLQSLETKNIKHVKRTFHDYYTKEQTRGNIASLYSILFSPIHIPIHLTNKFFFHLFKNRLKAYKLFDAFIVFDHNDDFITILPTNSEEREALKHYFLHKLDLDIKKADRFYKIDYGYEYKM